MSMSPGTRIMPAGWRRQPLTTPEYEWLVIQDLPRTLWHYQVLIQHRNTHDHVCATVTSRAGEDFNEVLKSVLRVMPQGLDAPLRHTTLWAFLNAYYFEQLFALYGYDRAAFAKELRQQFPVALHVAVQAYMRHYLHKKWRTDYTQQARRRAKKKPTTFRGLAKSVGQKLYEFGNVLDTWLWSQSK